MSGRIYSASEDKEYYFREGCHILEWLNDPDDPEVSVARARVPVGVTTRWHRLRDTVERYLVQSGRGVVEIDEGPAQDVAPGDLVLIPAMARQRIHNPGPEELVFLAICSPRFRPENYIDDED